MASPIPLYPAGEYYIVKFETSVTLYKCWPSYLLCAPTAMTCGFFVAMKSFNLCNSFSCHSSNIRHVLIRLHLLFTSTITNCDQRTATRAAVWAYLHTQPCERTFTRSSVNIPSAQLHLCSSCHDASWCEANAESQSLHRRRQQRHKTMLPPCTTRTNGRISKPPATDVY